MEHTRICLNRAKSDICATKSLAGEPSAATRAFSKSANFHIEAPQNLHKNAVNTKIIETETKKICKKCFDLKKTATKNKTDCNMDVVDKLEILENGIDATTTNGYAANISCCHKNAEAQTNDEDDMMVEFQHMQTIEKNAGVEQILTENLNAVTSLMLNDIKTTPTATTTTTLDQNDITTTTKETKSTTIAAVRPVTLASSTNITNTKDKNSATISTPKTPKSPLTLVQYQQQQQQHPTFVNNNTTKNYKGSSRQIKYSAQHQTLATVPETKLTPKTPPVTPDSPGTYFDDDLDSMYSFATTTSGRSTMSCDHPYVARNGTTFSGRKMKYVVHCSNHAGQVGPDYLTPTQRAQRQIRRLKELLCAARQDLEHKDTEIVRLTREVVELRLFKASLSSPEERSASSDAVTVREAELKTSQDVSPIVDMIDNAAVSSPHPIIGVGAAHQLSHHHHQQLHHSSVMQLSSSEMQSSFADSGHFEDLTSSSVHSKDSYVVTHTHDMACGSDDMSGAVGGVGGRNHDDDDDGDEHNVVDDEEEARNIAENYELQRQELIRMYEQRIEELIRNQDGVSSEMKRTHNDRIEALLQKLAECNTRYADIVPDYEHAKERIRELERHLEELQRRLGEQEEKHNKMYLHMYQQGQESERLARADQALELAHRAPNNKVSINELLFQLQSTQDELENIRTIYRRLLEAQKNRTHVDPEVTLQFLKSAIYYFLTDKENSQGHLQAIESILEFTEAEKINISKAHAPK